MRYEKRCCIARNRFANELRAWPHVKAAKHRWREIHDALAGDAQLLEVDPPKGVRIHFAGIERIERNL